MSIRVLASSTSLPNDTSAVVAKPSAAAGGAAIVASQSADDLLAETIAAAKRRVQLLVGPASVDQLVSKDGSIDYHKLAELVDEQNAKRLAASGGKVADLLT